MELVAIIVDADCQYKPIYSSEQVEIRPIQERLTDCGPQISWTL